MRLKIVALMGALLLASACSSSQKGAGANGAGGLTAGTAVPGSQQDLAQNIGDRVFFSLNGYDVNSEGQASTPVHDDESHGADGTRYLALVADQMTNDSAKSTKLTYETVPC